MRGVERMRAVVLGRDGATELRDVPVPRPRDGEILIRVTAVGLCGSDVEKLADGTGIEGSVLGHELAGVVEGGALPAGTRVALAHRVPCGACRDCLAGHETCCPQYLASGLRPGGFAELLVAPASHAGTVVLPLPDDVSDLAGTFVEPLGCIVRGAARVPHGTGVVAGCGAVGRLFARLLAARGDSGPHARRRSGPADGRGRGRLRAGRHRRAARLRRGDGAAGARRRAGAAAPGRHVPGVRRAGHAGAGAARPHLPQRAGAGRLAIGHARVAARGARPDRVAAACRSRTW